MTTAHKTELCITIDTEFSIAGAFDDPRRYAPVGERVATGDIDGQEHGLGFLLETFERYGISATFFVEALNASYFGDEAMSTLAHRIRAAGHDVQLHLHPCWLAFEDPAWKEKVVGVPPNDSCADRSLDDIAGLIGQGIDNFLRWGLPRPTAFRAGGLIVDRTVYKAMAWHGLQIGSNLGLAVYSPHDAALRFSGGRHWIEGVMELPVLTYKQPSLGIGATRRNLSITASSGREMRALLWQAHRARISPVVLLTHPFEFFKRDGPTFERLRRDRVNQERLAELCRFIVENNACFSAVSFSQGAAGWLDAGASEDPRLSVSASLVASRMAENWLNTHIWWY